jgi:hypothetical protein
MNVILGRSIVVAFGFASLVGTSAGAAEVSPSVMMKPMQAVTLDAGPRRVVSSFVVADGQCNLSARISEAFRERSAESVRIGATLAPGGTSKIDAGDGYLLQFACKDGAQAMTATMLGEARSAAASGQKETFSASTPRLAFVRATGI